MREWIDFERNGITFREVRQKEPPEFSCIFDWSTRIDGTGVAGQIEISHELMLRSIVDYRELISNQAFRQADHLVNSDKREIERRRHEAEWQARMKATSLDAFV
jgi:ribosomal protein S9